MAAQKELLLLVHRIPYPPNKGDKVRSFNLLKHLSQKYYVHLGAFIDDPADCQYKEAVMSYCHETCLLDIKPMHRKVASLKGLLNGQALTLPFYGSQKMHQWIKQLLVKRPIDAIVVFSSPMAQFAEPYVTSGRRLVVDFVDVDSEKWLQYADAKTWPMSWLYRREGKKLREYERRIAGEFDASVFVSADECALFQQLAPEVAERCYGVSNGVDTDYFSPHREYPTPYENGEGPVLVFTGAMDYWANIDAVTWFAKAVFTKVKERVANANFYIVGVRPTAEVRQLEKLPGVVVTGSVKDIRPYLAHANAAVAPLRIARGIQNKVLEAMSMALPVLATPEAAEGILAVRGRDLLIESKAAALENNAVRLLTQGQAELGISARQLVLDQYGWAQNLKQFDRLLGETEAASSDVDVDNASKAVML
jgi:sugar transferase (PEP-CTERM/EpsH1 system associated)